RFGPPNRGKKVYLQAGLHADEWPGMLVLQHLMMLLEQAEHHQRLRGEVVCVPFANPIGLSQHVAGYLAGRFDLAGTGNFNRNFGDLVTPVSQLVAGKLRSEEHTSELQSRENLVCRLLLEKKKNETSNTSHQN